MIAGLAPGPLDMQVVFFRHDVWYISPAWKSMAPSKLRASQGPSKSRTSSAVFRKRARWSAWTKTGMDGSKACHRKQSGSFTQTATSCGSAPSRREIREALGDRTTEKGMVPVSARVSRQRFFPHSRLDAWSQRVRFQTSPWSFSNGRIGHLKNVCRPDGEEAPEAPDPTSVVPVRADERPVSTKAAARAIRIGRSATRPNCRHSARCLMCPTPAVDSTLQLHYRKGPEVGRFATFRHRGQISEYRRSVTYLKACTT